MNYGLNQLIMGLNAIVLNVWGNIKMTAFDKALPKVQEATGRYDPPKENTLIATLAGKKPKKEDSTFETTRRGRKSGLCVNQDSRQTRNCWHG